MTRPRVDPSKRRRTAQACDRCKKRKSKCDGKLPCFACAQRGLDCSYTPGDTDTQPGASSQHGAVTTPLESSLEGWSQPTLSSMGTSSSTQSTPTISRSLGSLPQECFSQPEEPPDGFPKVMQKQTLNMDVQKRASVSADANVEIDNYITMRMLEDHNGRSVYYGNAANASFLQLLRTMVESTTGSSAFTLDLHRSHQMKGSLDASIQDKVSHQLPDKETALMLTNFFFIHSCGVFQIFDEETFLAKVDECYIDPLHTDRVWLGRFFMVLALGLSFATPPKGSRDAILVDQLRQMQPDQSQVFYFTGKSLYDPTANLEDANIRSIQTLACMTLYTLIHMNYDTAFNYCGLAVRSAHGIGLHREETLVIFPGQDQLDRRHLWQSLYIMEHLLAASLGRPSAIVDESWSENRLRKPILVESEIIDIKALRGAGLEATTRSCRIIGVILKDIYQQPKTSVTAAQSLVEKCMQLSWSLPAPLRWQEGSLCDCGQRAAIIHVNLTYWHTIILLTRPFFIYLVSAQIRRTFLGDSLSNSIRFPDERIAKFSNACVIASTNTIALVHHAHCSGSLSDFNFLTINHILAASLILMTKLFSWPSEDEKSAQQINNSIVVLDSLGDINPGAKGAATIISRYRDVLHRQAERRKEALCGQQHSQSAPRYAARRMSEEDKPTTTSAATTNVSQGGPGQSLPDWTQSTQPAFGLMETLAPQLSNEETFTNMVEMDGPIFPPDSDQDPIISDMRLDFGFPCQPSYHIDGISGILQ